MYLNHSKKHKNKHSTEEEGSKEVEIMAPLCRPKCVQCKAHYYHSSQNYRLQYYLPCLQQITSYRISEISYFKIEQWPWRYTEWNQILMPTCRLGYTKIASPQPTWLKDVSSLLLSLFYALQSQTEKLFMIKILEISRFQLKTDRVHIETSFCFLISRTCYTYSNEYHQVLSTGKSPTPIIT